MTKRFEITDKMAKGFAAEITSKREKLESKKGFHLANFMVNAKFGKREWDETYEHINVSWEFLYPFNSVVTNKRRNKIYFNENSCCEVPAKVLLYEIIKGVEDIEHVVELYKTEQFCIIAEGYPKFKEVIEKYGIEWFEKRIAEFYEYLTNLGGSEVNDTPILNEYGYENAYNDITMLREFVMERGNKITIEELTNVMESIEGIREKVNDSDVIDDDTKDNLFSTVCQFNIDVRNCDFTKLVSVVVCGLDDIRFFVK